MSSADRLAALLSEPRTRALMICLNDEAEEARIIGGAVRNALLDAGPSDVDFGTTALPDVVMHRVRIMGWKAVPTGIAHGTVTVVVDGHPFEVTTLREDIETDGRHAVVRFGRDFKRDAARRDFTMNAIGLDARGQVHDYFGGLADLEARRIRFIGDADTRIREDYLRALRFLRFSAAYGQDALDAQGLAAVLRNRAGFSFLSRERIRQEILKLLDAPRAVPVIAEAEGHGIVSSLVGAAIDVERLGACLAIAPYLSPLHRLFILAITGTGEAGAAEAKRLAASLRLSVREEAVLAGIARLLAVPQSQHHAHHIAYRASTIAHLGMAEARTALVIKASASHQSGMADLAALPEHAPSFLISGQDLMALGVNAGPQLGQALGATEARWIAAGLPEGRDAQMQFLPSAV